MNQICPARFIEQLGQFSDSSPLIGELIVVFTTNLDSHESIPQFLMAHSIEDISEIKTSKCEVTRSLQLLPEPNLSVVVAPPIQAFVSEFPKQKQVKFLYFTKAGLLPSQLDALEIFNNIDVCWDFALLVVARFDLSDHI